MMNVPSKAVRALIEPVFRRHEFLQVAALCLRDGKAGPEVLMVTSRGTGRWVLPKGWPMKGRSLAGAALQEAWEEAGVIGRADEASLGWYGYDKQHKGGLPLACRVELFRVAVTDLAKDWPEARKRRRRWMRPEEAAGKVAEPMLRELLLKLP